MVVSNLATRGQLCNLPKSIYVCKVDKAHRCNAIFDIHETSCQLIQQLDIDISTWCNVTFFLSVPLIHKLLTLYADKEPLMRVQGDTDEYLEYLYTGNPVSNWSAIYTMTLYFSF